MPIRDMMRYAALRQAGQKTAAERSAILRQHSEAVRARVAALQSSLLVLDEKIAGYSSASHQDRDT